MEELSCVSKESWYLGPWSIWTLYFVYMYLKLWLFTSHYLLETRMDCLGGWVLDSWIELKT